MIETYIDKKINEMRKHIYTRCEKLIKEAEKLETEADRKSDEAGEHIENGNELEWEEAIKECIEKQAYADGIRHALEMLELI